MTCTVLIRWGLFIFEVHQTQSAGIPEFVNEVTIAFDPFFGHFYVTPLGGKGGQGKPEGISAIGVDDIQRVDDVALGLAHFLTLFVPHERVNVNVTKRHVSHKMDSHHHHSGDPEEENVESGHQGGGRIKNAQ